MLQVLLKSNDVTVSQNRGSRNALPKVIALLSTACVLALSGCHAKEAAPAATSRAATGPTTPQTLTPAQQAAIQRADQQGPAIQAAIQASNGGK